MQKLFTAMAQVSAACMLMVLAGFAVAQHAYPNKPIRIIVAFPPGGPVDILARMAAQKLAESWGQPVIVDNRPGGNAVIGTEAVAKSPPDGYTILLAGGGFVNTPLRMPTPYDVIKDFAPVATLGRTESILALPPSVPANTLQEFIEVAESNRHWMQKRIYRGL